MEYPQIISFYCAYPFHCITRGHFFLKTTYVQKNIFFIVTLYYIILFVFFFIFYLY